MPLFMPASQGVWTPAIAFATPGDSNIVLSTAVGYYQRVGPLVRAQFRVITSTFTHSTASSSLVLSGLPFVVKNNASGWGLGSLLLQGVTKANYTQFLFRATPGAATAMLVGSGSGQNYTNIAAADMPSGGSVILDGAVIYEPA